MLMDLKNMKRLQIQKKYLSYKSKKKKKLQNKNSEKYLKSMGK